METRTVDPSDLHRVRTELRQDRASQVVREAAAMKRVFSHALAFSAAIWLVALTAPIAIGQTVQSLTEFQSLMETGIQQRRSGLHSESIKTLQRALTVAKKTGDIDNEWVARAMLALTYQEKGDLRQALAVQNENLAFARRHRDKLRQGPMDRERDTLQAISAVYTLLGNFDKAVEILGPPPPRSNSPDLGRAHFLQRRGINWFLAGKLADADGSLTEALAEYEASGFAKLVPDGYEFQVEVLRWLQAVRVAQKRTDEALELAERGRSRAFGDLLSARRSVEGTSPRDSLVPDLRRIKQVARAQRSTLVIYSIIHKYDPSLPLEFGGYDKLPVRDIYIWVVKPTGEIAFRKVSFEQRPESFGDLVRLARESIGVRGRGTTVTTTGSTDDGANPKQDNFYLRRLYEILVRPIADLLPSDASNRVTFIPQDVLFLVPFAALQSSDGTFLIERHTILIAPSVQVLELSGRAERSSEHPAADAVIVGNPKMPRMPGITGRLAETLDRLPGAEQEARVIARLLKTQPIIGEQATKTAVVSRMPAAAIIHLATHGLLDDIGGNFSAIALAPDKDDGGWLTSRETLALRLNADLVVLSACDTGRGKLSGDGVVGLSRSFIAAGAASVVVSLWQVSDAATLVLMTAFYDNLQKGQDKAQALRQAMLRTRMQHLDPREWSAFMLFGGADVSDSLRVLLREGASSRAEAARVPNSDRSPYRFFVFPLPADVQDYHEWSSYELFPGATFSTDLSVTELMAFYRRALTQRGLVEDSALSHPDDSANPQLVFTGPNGGSTIRVVIQLTKGTKPFPEWGVSLRVEPRR